MLPKIIRILIMTLVCSTAFSAEASFHVTATKELPNQLGMFRTIEFNTPDKQAVTIYAVTFNSNYQANFHLQENRIQFFANYLDAASLEHDFIVGINGGFYQPNFTPAGLFIYQGKKIKPLVRSSIFNSCVLIQKNKKITIAPSLDACTNTDNVMQTGPLLIQNGKANKASLERIKNKSKSLEDFFNPHKRTLLALTDKNQLIMITTSQLTLLDAAYFLQNHPDAFGAKHIQSAINLDGGSSTGMYIRFPDAPFYFHELKHVKTFIFVNPGVSSVTTPAPVRRNP